MSLSYSFNFWNYVIISEAQKKELNKLKTKNKLIDTDNRMVIGRGDGGSELGQLYGNKRKLDFGW